MKKIVLTVALVFLSTVAFAAKKQPTPQNHSCVLKEAVVEKTKKECLKAGGKWEKNSNLPSADAKPADAKPADAAAPADAKPADKPADAKPAK